MKNTDFDKAVGNVIKNIKQSVGWSSNRLAREITVQIYKSSLVDNSEEPIIDVIKNLNGASNKSIEAKQIISEYINSPNTDNCEIEINGKTHSLSSSVSPNSINDYINGRTAVPLIVLINFCQLFNISLDDFMTQVYKKLKLEWSSNNNSCTFEEAFNEFSKNAFGVSDDNRYVYSAIQQKNLFSSLLFEGKEKTQFHFTYLPRILGLKSLKDNKEVLYQRGILTFELRDGMCHVTSQLEVSSQGIPTEYRGFAVITNPNSVGPACTCFLKEMNNLFGIFILFSFRLSPLEKSPKRKTRISECMAVRKEDGTSYVYRLLLSKNYIDDENIKSFVGHLKIGTSENTNEGHELNILIKEKYINIAKKFFNNSCLSSHGSESAIFSDLRNHFGEDDFEEYKKIIELLDNMPMCHAERIQIIDPKKFDINNKYHLLFLGWLGKYGLSARNDKVENSLDDHVENIHKSLYPELHKDIEVDRGLLHY